MPSLPRHLPIIAAVVAASLSACLDSQEPNPGPAKEAPDPAAPAPDLSIGLIGGNNQESAAGFELVHPLEVRVTRAGAGVEGVAVAWHVASGEGRFRPSSATHTDADGRSLIFFTPFTQGARVTASVASGAAASEFRVLPLPFTVYENAGQRLVFYPDSTMALHHGSVVYSGEFTRSDSVLNLHFDRTWNAVATVRGRSVSVDYDFLMEMDGFVDTDFFLAPTTGTSPGWFENPGATVPVVDQRVYQLLGNGQEGPVGVELPEPFVLKVFSPTGSVAGARVIWRVDAGGGSFRPTADTVTDRAGESRVYFTPSTDGALLSATLPGTPSTVRFRSFPPPVAAYGSPSNGFAFYPNSSFAMRLGGNVWSGDYSRADSTLSLSFDSPGAARAVIRGDSLVVAFLGNMSMDFDNMAVRLDSSRTLDNW